MSGWVPMPADGWDETAELLTSTGKPWPDQATIADLRWQMDQRGEVYGRPTLRRRWNWTDRRVRSLLASPERWWDPIRGPVPVRRSDVQPVSSSRPADVQPVSSSRPALDSSNLDNCEVMSSSRPADVQPVSSSRPADVHRRADPPSPSQPPSPSPSEKTDVGRAPLSLVLPLEPSRAELSDASQARATTERDRRAEFQEALRVWNQEIVPAARALGARVSEHPRLSPSEGIGVGLRQRIDAKGLPAVLAVFRWYANHPDAAFLRDNGHEMDTLTGARKFEKYAAAASRPEPTAQARASPAPGRKRFSMFDAFPDETDLLSDIIAKETE